MHALARNSQMYYPDSIQQLFICYSMTMLLDLAVYWALNLKNQRKHRIKYFLLFKQLLTYATTNRNGQKFNTSIIN